MQDQYWENALFEPLKVIMVSSSIIENIQIHNLEH